jgi:hypothetical protein
MIGVTTNSPCEVGNRSVIRDPAAGVAPEAGPGSAGLAGAAAGAALAGAAGAVGAAPGCETSVEVFAQPEDAEDAAAHVRSEKASQEYS